MEHCYNETRSMDLTPAHRTLPSERILASFQYHRDPHDRMWGGGAGGKETVDHYLLNCELYGEERDTLRRRMDIQGINISRLLGNTKTIKEMVEYIEKTGWFKLER